jgi:hypothetical protein
VSSVTSIAKRKLQQSHNRRGAMWCMVNKHVGGDIGWKAPPIDLELHKYKNPSRLDFFFS